MFVRVIRPVLIFSPGWLSTSYNMTLPSSIHISYQVAHRNGKMRIYWREIHWWLNWWFRERLIMLLNTRLGMCPRWIQRVLVPVFQEWLWDTGNGNPVGQVPISWEKNSTLLGLSTTWQWPWSASSLTASCETVPLRTVDRPALDDFLLWNSWRHLWSFSTERGTFSFSSLAKEDSGLCLAKHQRLNVTHSSEVVRCMEVPFKLFQIDQDWLSSKESAD